MADRVVQGRRVLNIDAHERPGDFSFDVNHEFMVFTCPCGNGHFGSVNLNPKAERPCWSWDGNEEAPTITPSINVNHIGNCWHGYLRAGKWESV